MLAMDYREVVQHLKNRIIGQETALEQIEQALMLAQAGIGDPEKPLCVLFFAGPTGVGKSEAVVALAEALGSEICRIDGNQLTQSHTIASLTGSPPGYVGSAEGNTTLDKKVIEGTPGHPGILVIEEIEKAHPSIWDALLSVFDKATLKMTNGKGHINFVNCFIIITSNIGSRELKDEVSKTPLGFCEAREDKEDLNLDGDTRKGIVHKAMGKAFRPEFLGRIDYIVTFRWLTQPELLLIVDRFIRQLNDRLMGRQLYLEVTDPARNYLVSEGFDIKYGARPLKSAVRKHLEVPLSKDICLFYKEGTKYIARLKKGEVVFDKTQLPILRPKVELVQGKKTVHREVSMKLGGDVNTVHCSLYPEEAEVFDRWVECFVGTNITLYLMNITSKEMVALVRLLTKVEGRLHASKSNPEPEDIVQLVTAAILRAKGVFTDSIFWKIANNHI